MIQDQLNYGAESTLVKDLSVPLTHHDLIDLGLLILS